MPRKPWSRISSRILRSTWFPSKYCWNASVLTHNEMHRRFSLCPWDIQIRKIMLNFIRSFDQGETPPVLRTPQYNAKSSHWQGAVFFWRCNSYLLGCFSPVPRIRVCLLQICKSFKYFEECCVLFPDISYRSVKTTSLQTRGPEWKNNAKCIFVPEHFSRKLWGRQEWDVNLSISGPYWECEELHFSCLLRIK